MRNVAIVGEFASGKTTLADYLIYNFGFKRISFAGHLKRVAGLVYGERLVEGAVPAVEKAKMYEVWGLGAPGPYDVSGREILQQLGQAVKELDKLFWIRWLMNDVDAGIHGPGPFVIDDCRFPYEADALRERGFLVARIMTPTAVRMQRYENVYGRPPTFTEMNHPSETEVANISWDVVVDGQQSPQRLAEALVEELKEAA